MIASLFCWGGTSMDDGWLLRIPILFSACPVHPLNLHSHPWPVHPSIFHVVSFQWGQIKHETITWGHHKGRASELKSVCSSGEDPETRLIATQSIWTATRLESPSAHALTQLLSWSQINCSCCDTGFLFIFFSVALFSWADYFSCTLAIPFQ